MIRFFGREKHNEIKSAFLKRPYLQNRQRKLIHPNFIYKILLEKNPLKRNLLRSYPLKRNMYLKIMRNKIIG
jgi:hypothetical protein